MKIEENAQYFGLDFNPQTVEEAFEALRKISDMSIAYKPLVASAALKYYSVITNKVEYCDYRNYLTGDVYNKMASLAGKQPASYVNSPGYFTAFSSAIDLMIRKSEFYFEHKEKFDSGLSYREILEIKS